MNRANAPVATGTRVSSAPETEVLNLSMQKLQWKTTGDIDRVADLFDDELVFVHLNGRITSKAEWIEELRSGRFAYKAIRVQETPSVRAYEGAVVLVGKAQFSVAMSGHAGKFNLVYTEVYARKQGRWKLVNLHTCAY